MPRGLHPTLHPLDLPWPSPPPAQPQHQTPGPTALPGAGVGVGGWPESLDLRVWPRSLGCQARLRGHSQVAHRL